MDRTHVEHVKEDLSAHRGTVPALRKLDRPVDAADDDGQAGQRERPHEHAHRLGGQGVDPADGVEAVRVGVAAEQSGAGAEVEVQGDGSEDEHRNELEDDATEHDVGAVE
jgi:hypothetical protein